MRFIKVSIFYNYANETERVFAAAAAEFQSWRQIKICINHIIFPKLQYMKMRQEESKWKMIKGRRVKSDQERESYDQGNYSILKSNLYACRELAYVRPLPFYIL